MSNMIAYIIPIYKLFRTLIMYAKLEYARFPGGGGGTPLCDLNRDVRPDRVWFSRRFVLNGVSISSLSVLKTVPIIVIVHTFCAPRDTRVSYR